MKIHMLPPIVLLLLAASCAAPAGPELSPSVASPSVAHPPRQEDLTSLEFDVMGMTCDTCANTATELLAKVSGVHAARVDFESKSGSVAAGDGVTADDIRDALSVYGFEARFDGDAPADSVPLPESEKTDLDIRTVSEGGKVNFEDALAPGKITVFDYYAEWCGPCHLLTPKLERLVQRYGNVALRKVDIVDWESDAARQASSEFGLGGLPYVRVYGPNGEVLGSVVGNHIEQVEALLEGHVQR